MRLLSKTLDVIWCNWGFNDAITVKGCDFLNSSDRSAGSNAHLHPTLPTYLWRTDSTKIRNK